MLTEEIWLELPFCSIVKALNAIYGLKQLALKWYKELRDQPGRKYEDRLYINMNTKRSLHFRTGWEFLSYVYRYDMLCKKSCIVQIPVGKQFRKKSCRVKQVPPEKHDLQQQIVQIIPMNTKEGSIRHERSRSSKWLKRLAADRADHTNE